MKKSICFVLGVLLVLSMAMMSGCGAQALKIGVGVHAVVSEVKDAEGDANGAATIDETVAAVLIDESGKIVAATIDVLSAEAKFTAEGKFVPATEFVTKREAGDNYGMAAGFAAGYAQDANGDGKVLEWYQQADAFCKLLVGKTADEAKALVAENAKGTDEVINAGCTIYVSDFALAVDKAIANAKECDAKAADTLKIGINAAQGSDSKDATEDANGANQIVADVAAVALGADGKTTATMTDCADVTIAFDNAGKCQTEQGTIIITKRAQRDSYGMAAGFSAGYAKDLNGDGKVLEWYQQADAMDAALTGKTADEIGAAVVNGYGTDDIQTAGCTIAISGAVKALVKAATVA